MFYYISAYNSSTGSVGKGPGLQGPANTQIHVDRSSEGSLDVSAFDVAAGEYIIAVYVTDVGDHTAYRLCPAFRFRVGAGETGFVGTMLFDRFQFVALESSGIGIVKKSEPDAVPLEIQRTSVRPEMLPSYGRIGGMVGVECSGDDR